MHTTVCSPPRSVVFRLLVGGPASFGAFRVNCCAQVPGSATSNRSPDLYDTRRFVRAIFILNKTILVESMSMNPLSRLLSSVKIADYQINRRNSKLFGIVL